MSDSTTPMPEAATAQSLEETVAKMVFEALQAELAGQLQTGLGEIQAGLDALAVRLAHVKQAGRVSGPRPSISPPEKYDGVLKALADQFIRQVEAAAEFEVFRDNRQKILWAQSYLMGSAQAWSCVITTGPNNVVTNPRRFQWAEWLADFKAAFGMRDPAQDALNHIGVLQQGSKLITEYCTTFFELKGKLSPSDANSDYVKDRFWKGLSAAAMEALVNTDYDTAEQARDILLHQESKLTDLAARRKGAWHAPNANACTAVSASSTPLPPAQVRAAPPPPLADPNAMDVDHAKATPTVRKCFKCKKAGHLMVECPLWAAAIKAAVREAMAGGEAKVEGAPAAGFV